MACPANGEQLVLLVSHAHDCGARPLIVGNGTNLFIPDEGLDRLVVDTTAAMNHFSAGKTPGTIEAESGTILARLADLPASRAWPDWNSPAGSPGQWAAAFA